MGGDVDSLQGLESLVYLRIIADFSDVSFVDAVVYLIVFRREVCVF